MIAGRSGIDLIAAERRRQIDVEDWTPEHDDEHDDGSLAMVAICYAAPVPVFVRTDYANSIEFNDPWPSNWASRYDRRKYDGNVLVDAGGQTSQERIRCLVKAGALIAAEIDRLQRAEAVAQETAGASS